MARALSGELRERVVASIKGGAFYRRAAERFGFGVSAASKMR